MVGFSETAEIFKNRQNKGKTNGKNKVEGSEKKNDRKKRSEKKNYNHNLALQTYKQRYFLLISDEVGIEVRGGDDSLLAFHVSGGD